MKKRYTLSQNLASIVLIFCGIITLTILGIVVISSLRSYEDLTLNGTWAVPESFTLENYRHLILEDSFYVWMGNSLLIAVAATALNLYIACLASYGLMRYQFKGRKLLRMYFLFGLMFPCQLSIVPLFIMFRNLNLTNHLMGVILIYAGGLSLPIFVLSNFIKTIPYELNEAAKIDGAGEFLIFNRIIFPLLSPAVASLIPLTLTAAWNDFFMPMIFLKDSDKKTIPLGIMKYISGTGFKFSEINNVYAAAALSILPIMIVYFAASKKIIAGLTSGAVKE